MCTIIDQALPRRTVSAAIGALRYGTASQLAGYLSILLKTSSSRLLAPGVKRECVEGGGRTAVATLFLQARKLDPCRLRTLDVWHSEDRQVVPAY